jgi:hypothetical protein
MAVAYALIAIAFSLVAGALVWPVSPLAAVLSSPFSGSSAVLLAGLAVVGRALAQSRLDGT